MRAVHQVMSTVHICESNCLALANRTVKSSLLDVMKADLSVSYLENMQKKLQINSMVSDLHFMCRLVLKQDLEMLCNIYFNCKLFMLCNLTGLKETSE